MRLALGTAQFGLNYGIANRHGQVSRYDVKEIIDLAQASGMDTLDTAISYGDCEQRLGEIGVRNWNIVSKLPEIPEGCGNVTQWVANSVSQSIENLRTNKLYGLLLHRPQQLLEKNGAHLFEGLQKLKRDGLINKIGISIYDPSELDVLCDRFQFDLVQAPFNILDRRLIHTGWLTRLNEQDIELHVRSVFLQGLLLMDVSDRPAKFGRWSNLWLEWHDWLDSTGLTPMQACLRFALTFQGIGKVIVGVDSQLQLKDIIQAGKSPDLHAPAGLVTDDPELINPALWGELA